MEVIRRSLQTGSLLEDEHFPIARKLLRAFLKRRRVRADDWIVLNGLPRHAGQASALERLLAVKAVVRLNCSARTVRRRIATDAGGDRTGRADDLPREVARRLRLFRRRTVPLLDYYASRKIHILQLRVGVDASAEDLRQRLQTLIRA
jgi:adenylate kinase family enzyme